MNICIYRVVGEWRPKNASEIYSQGDRRAGFADSSFLAAMAIMMPIMDRLCGLCSSANWVNALGDSLITVEGGNEKNKRNCH